MAGQGPPVSEHRKPVDAVGDARELIAELSAFYRAAQLSTRLIRGIPRMRATVAAVRNLPVLAISLSDTPRGRDIATAFTGRQHGVRRTVAVAVLELPDDAADYLRGRRRQAVRTNCTRAREAGLSYRSPAAEADTAAIITEITAGRPSGAEERRWLLNRLASSPGHFRYVADRDDRPIALNQFTVDGTVARLNVGVSIDCELTSAARHLVSAELFQELAATGVRYVLTDCELFAREGTRYFQKRLGFTAANLRITLSRGSTAAGSVAQLKPSATVVGSR